MAHWPLASGPVINEPQVGTSDLTAVTLTGSATPHAKGAWTEIDAAVPNGVVGIIIAVDNSFVSAGNSSQLMDVGIGAAGSEMVMIADLGVGYRASNGTVGVAWAEYIPLRVPDGVRLAARIQGAVASDTVVTFWAYVYGQSHNPARSFAECVTMGANAATSRGVTVTAAASAGVKGAWAQIVASTPARIAALLPFVQGNAATSISNINNLLDIGVGGAGAEAVLISNIPVAGNSTEQIGPRRMPALSSLVDVNVPEGSRLAARIASSNPNQGLDVILLGCRR